MRLGTFPPIIARALVVEQLNRTQWHVALRGDPAPAGSLEALPSGVTSFAGAVRQAVETAEFTGLPVLIEPYQQPLAPLPSPPPVPGFWQHRFRRSMDLDYIMYGLRQFGGAA
jgi:hypothetical protein